MQVTSSTTFDFFPFFQMTPDLVCMVSKDGFFKKINPAVVERLKYSEEELMEQPVSAFIHPDDKEVTKYRRAKLLRGQALLNFQNRYVAKDGSVVWLEWTSIYAPDKEMVFAIAKDITTRKISELEVEGKYKKLKVLASNFKNAIENDREHISAELHEEIAQLASVVKMDLDWVSQSLHVLPEPTRIRMDNAIVVANLLINTIRRMSFSISPHMIRDLGLNATFNWHCEEFARINGIPCYFETAFEDDEHDHDIKVDLFRICQESLSNVMYHAQAGMAKVTLEQSPGGIRLTVMDDGIGFNRESAVKLSGLVRIRERAELNNGSVLVHSSPGMGTSVVAFFSRNA